MDKDAKIQEMKEIVALFSRERDWEQFHNPKDLGVALGIEVSELMEHFRYKTNEEIEALLNNALKKKEVSDELADVFWMVLRLSEVCKIDLSDALKEKVKEAAGKYPVEKGKGNSQKYTHYK